MRIKFYYFILFLLILSCQLSKEERTLTLKYRDSLSVTIEGSGQRVLIVTDSGKVKSLQVANPSLTEEDQFLFVDTNFLYYTHIQKGQKLQPLTFFYPHGVVSANYFTDGPFVEGWVNRFSVLGNFFGKQYFTHNLIDDSSMMYVKYYNSGFPALSRSSFLHVFYNSSNELVVNYFGYDSLRRKQVQIIDEHWNVLLKGEMDFSVFKVPASSLDGKAHLVRVESIDNNPPNRMFRLFMKVPSEDEYILKAADEKLDTLPLW